MRGLTSAALGLAYLAAATLAGAGDGTATPTRTQSGPLDLSIDHLEPEVTRQDHDNRMVEEYRYNGNPYMLKVTPKNGAPSYYLVDPTGNGEYEWRRNTPGLEVRPPQWTLSSW
jgi:hypothetical protein